VTKQAQALFTNALPDAFWKAYLATKQVWRSEDMQGKREA
jgi:hypothetical protein